MYNIILVLVDIGILNKLNLQLLILYHIPLVTEETRHIVVDQS